MPIRPGTALGGAESALMWKSPVLFLCVRPGWLLQSSFPGLMNGLSIKWKGTREEGKLQEKQGSPQPAEEEELALLYRRATCRAFLLLLSFASFGEVMAYLSLLSTQGETQYAYKSFFKSLRDLDKRRSAQLGFIMLGVGS